MPLCVYFYVIFFILILFQYTGTHKTYNVPLKMSTLNQLCSIIIKTETKGHWLDKRLLVFWGQQKKKKTLPSNVTGSGINLHHQ